MSGLDSEQLDELEWRIEDQLEEPWHKGIGRPKDLSLRGVRLFDRYEYLLIPG
jgi:hypothetical protein